MTPVLTKVITANINKNLLECTRYSICNISNQVLNTSFSFFDCQNIIVKIFYGRVNIIFL